MSTVIPAIRGQLGNTEFYETTMKVRDLVKSVRPPREMDGWATFGIEERMQRDADLPRIKKQLAPYIARNPDRFFGSIIVLVYDGVVIFEPMAEVAKGVPAAYKQNAQRIGFLTIDGGMLVVLDGQHRLLALEMVLKGDAEGQYLAEVPNDDICVIFIKHEDNVKTRRIFNTVNRYAKQTSRGDNIITSEDDGYAIVARALLRDEMPLGSRIYGGKREDLVEWKNNTLGPRSTSFTTIGVVYETVKLALEDKGIPRLNIQERPDDADIERYTDYTAEIWRAVLSGIEAYQIALADPKKIPAMRKDEAHTSLLFKPAAQIALFDGLLRARAYGLTLEEAVGRANGLTVWGMTESLWQNIIIKSGGTIDAGADARERMALIVSYLIAADRMGEKEKASIWKRFTEARLDEAEDLPTPAVGPAYTATEATAFVAAQDLKVA